MNNKQDSVVVFGYGLAMFIPFFLMLHGMEHKLGFIRFVICVGLVLTVIAKVQQFKPIYFVVLIGIYAVLAHQLQTNGMTTSAVIWISLAVILLTLASARPQILIPVYDLWMKGAHAIGTMLTGLLLVVIYYSLFTIAGMALRLLRKDLLDRGLQPDRETYWHVRPPQPFEQKNYQRQF
jgi:hypothetical protein